MNSLSVTEESSLGCSETVQADRNAGTTATPTYSTVEDFVAHVIYDGRFLQDFTAEPEHVAMQLGITISSEVAAALRGRDRGEVLSEVTDRMTRDYGQRTVSGTIPDVRADFGISAIVVIGAIVVLVVVKICTAETTIVTDESQDSGQKL